MPLVAALILLASVGAGIAGYLTVLHYALQQGAFLEAPACVPGTFLDCHAVNLHHASMIAGKPLAAVGLLLYGLWIALAVVAWVGERQHRIASLRLILASAVAALLVDAYLAWVMLARVHAVCVWCAATYGINVLVVVLSWWSLQRAGESPWRWGQACWLLMPWSRQARATQPVVSTLLVAWSVTIALAAWSLTAMAEQFMARGLEAFRTQVRQYLRQEHPLEMETQQSPTIGATQPRVTVVEFSDFQCPACQKSSTILRALVLNYPKAVALTFKHYPLDTACNPQLERQVHPGACRLAAALACAHAQGAFWDLHDRVFAAGPSYTPLQLEDDIQALGLDVPRWQQCVQDGTGLGMVQRDLAAAHQLDVTSTPTAFFNGYRFGGALPPAAVDIIMDELLRGQHAPRTPSRDPVSRMPSDER